jgi:hypothetical protein
VAGLVATIFTLIAARSAATAARQARQAVLATTLAEEINLARAFAAEVGSLVDLGKFELARLRCNDLHDRTLMMLNRWNGNLSIVSRNNLLNAKLQLDVLRSAMLRLAVGGAVPTARQLSQLQTGCEKIRDAFIVEHASAMRRNDEADNA